MKVTLTLGKRAIEFVTGIPEEELPEILSDVLERSLEQQVKPILPDNTSNVQTNDELLNKLKEMMVEVMGSQPSIPTSLELGNSTSYKRTEVSKKKVENPITKTVSGNEDLEDEFNLLK